MHKIIELNQDEITVVSGTKISKTLSWIREIATAMLATGFLVCLPYLYKYTTPKTIILTLFDFILRRDENEHRE